MFTRRAEKNPGNPDDFALVQPHICARVSVSYFRSREPTSRNARDGKFYDGAAFSSITRDGEEVSTK